MNQPSMSRNRAQVYSIGNYLMTGKVLGKGHFARVEEATHRVIGKKVAIKIIDLTSIKEEYARRNLHREPRVMAKLRHPCIAALYETMMHGPRLYVVMEAACGGDLCTHVAARGRGLPEQRARPLSAQLLSATRHMHARGVVHRDLKMENIMLDGTKQFIKIVDFGLSNVWSAGGALRTPCGSLEYAAPELFVDGRRYGPEVDLWSIGVIVYGMVTGGLPFSGADAGAAGAAGAGAAGGEVRSRPLLRAAIARGFCRKQRAALACVSNECKMFIQHLLEPNVALRMKIEEAARHRWIRKPGMRMKTHPFGPVDPKVNREIYRQISELTGKTVIDVVAQITAEPFGSTAGVYNIKTHLHQLQASPGTDLLWTSTQDPPPLPPPEYRESYERQTAPSSSKTVKQPPNPTPKVRSIIEKPTTPARICQMVEHKTSAKTDKSPGCTINRPFSTMGVKKQVYKVNDNGDGLDPRLPCIDEHSSSNAEETRYRSKAKPCVRKANMDPPRLNSCPDRFADRRCEFYRRAGDALPNWRANGNNINTPPARVLYQSNASTIKRASMGNIVSPHSSSNSHCRSERSMPVTWYSTRTSNNKEGAHIQRLRRTAPMK